MTRWRIRAIFLSGLMFTGCITQSPTDDGCGGAEAVPCSCPSGRESQTVCVDGNAVCDCADAGTSDDAQPADAARDAQPADAALPVDAYAADAQRPDAAPGDCLPVDEACGPNLNGHWVGRCERGTFVAETCEGRDTCANGTELEAMCGLNGVGREAWACIDGAWQSGGCEDPDACIEDSVRFTPCGANGSGAESSHCVEGQWRTGNCDDPAQCVSGDTQTGRCSPDGSGDGEHTRTCVSGWWSAWPPCEFMNVCEAGDLELAFCGLNGLGRAQRHCVDGQWSMWSECDRPDTCVNDSVWVEACGINGDGLLRHTCVEGQWTVDVCDDPAHCANGATQLQSCGANRNSEQSRVCHHGHWSEWTACLDVDVCVNGRRRRALCDEGTRPEHCVDGTWWATEHCSDRCADDSAPPCDNSCPQPRATEQVLNGEPLSVFTLDASPSIDTSSPTGRPVEYAWSVIQAPARSTSIPRESFRNPAAPEAGGPADDTSTPEAVFFADVVGEYVLELMIVGANGISAPSPECPAVAARVVINATAGGGIHVEMTWDTPSDLDQTDAVGSDVDLHLLHPTARQWSAAPLDCFYANTNPDWGEAGIVGNPSLDIDDTNGAGPENITIEVPEDTDVLGNPYKVGAHYFRAVAVGVDPSLVRIRIHLDGILAFESDRALQATDHFWEVANIHWGAQRRVSILDRYHQNVPR